MLLGTDGHVYTCGLNDYGQLGHSNESTSDSDAPLFVPWAKRVEGLPQGDEVVGRALTFVPSSAQHRPISAQLKHFRGITLVASGTETAS